MLPLLASWHYTSSTAPASPCRTRPEPSVLAAAQLLDIEPRPVPGSPHKCYSTLPTGNSSSSGGSGGAGASSNSSSSSGDSANAAWASSAQRQAFATSTSRYSESKDGMFAGRIVQSHGNHAVHLLVQGALCVVRFGIGVSDRGMLHPVTAVAGRRGTTHAAHCQEATHVPSTARYDCSNHPWHPGMWVASLRPTLNCFSQLRAWFGG